MVTDILLGSQWSEAANFIGLWALTSAVTIVLSHYSSEVYRSLGRPKLSVLAQFLHLIVLCPAMLIATKYDWNVIYVTRALVRIELVLVNIIIMYYFIRIPLREMIGNVMPSILSACVMGFVSWGMLKFYASYWWMVLVALFCLGIYMLMVTRFKDEKQAFVSLVQHFVKRK